MRDIVAITGTMFAGKTTRLIEEYRLRTESGSKCLLIKHSNDIQRYGLKIHSHDGVEIECLCLSHLDMRAILEDHSDVDTILVDEIQFFHEDTVWGFVHACVDNDISLVASGLNRDRDGNPFESMKTLFFEASEIYVLSTKCECGAMATETILKDENTRNPIGGSDKYFVSCLDCEGDRNAE